MRPWSATITPPQLDRRTLALFCELLTELDAQYLADHPETPLLYESGVWYEPDEDAIMGEPESWRSIPWVIVDAKRGKGADCKRLAAWRTAEARVRHGFSRAVCDSTVTWGGDRWLYHVFTDLGDGTQEDPSALILERMQRESALAQWEHSR